MWPDTETDIDFINFSEAAYAAAELITADAMLPISLGVFGGWGSGKSSILRLISRALDAQGGEGRHFIKVNFDAWLFQGYDDARAALMEVVARTILDQVKENETTAAKVVRILRRVNYLRAIGTAADIGASIALGIPPLGLGKRSLDAIHNFLTGGATGDDLAALKDGASELKKAGEGLLRPEERQTPPQEIVSFRREFAELLAQLNCTLVVFIDNLDRCLPDVAIETLEAVRLFLFMPHTAFVIAADESMIQHAVSKHYGDPTSRHVTDYLDKLIQVPLRVPLLGVPEVNAYTMLLFLAASGVQQAVIEEVRVKACRNLSLAGSAPSITPDFVMAGVANPPPSLKSELEMAARLAPTLATAPNIGGNPRIIKRLLNTLRMRSSLARRRSIQIDEGLIAKLLVFERCVDQRAFAKLVDLVNETEDGKPKLFVELEGALQTADSIAEKLPDEWKASAEFIDGWLRLAPAISSYDLRPLIYLSKETARAVLRSGQLSAQAVQALETLLAVTSVSSNAAKQTAEQLSLTDRRDVMDALIGDLRRHPDLMGKRRGLIGAIILADQTEACAQQLVTYLRAVPKGSVDPGILIRLKNRAWAAPLLSNWS